VINSKITQIDNTDNFPDKLITMSHLLHNTHIHIFHHII